MAQRVDVLHSFVLMRESLRVSLRETREISGIAVEEEVLVELERMDRICSRALRDTARAVRLLRRSIT